MKPLQVGPAALRLTVSFLIIFLLAGCEAGTGTVDSTIYDPDTGVSDGGPGDDADSDDAGDSEDSSVEPECAGAEDCDSGVCDTDTGMCVEASCDDSVQNGDETDVDCGGSCTDRCGAGASCTASSDCAENATCDASTSACSCEEGYAVSEDGSCVDVDECADGSASCDANATCTNTDGAFACACDGPDFVGDGFTCYPSTDCENGSAVCDSNAACVDQGNDRSICECSPGYSGDGISCSDTDECAQGTDNCDALAACTNTNGAFTCGSCPAGYDDVNGDGTSCVDTDECTQGTDNCDALTACTNTDGGFTCSSCPAGYNDVNGDGTSCVDTDECAQGTDNCDALTTCTNTVGSFTCSSCPTGYNDVNGDGTSCVDTDECAQGTDNCDALVTCTNTDGGFTCSSCPTGYDDVNGDGTSCVDVDECTQGTDNCDALVTCTNTDGGFTCDSCPAGYDDVNGDGTSCVDIDECTQGTDNCDALVACNNTDGSFTCGSCPTGYDDVNGDGTSCVLFGSCAEIANNSSSPATGTYTIDTGTGGPVDAYCDFDIDGGVGYTMYRIDDASLTTNQDDYRAACASVGMELIVPRTRAHASSIQTWNGGFPGIVGVYPKFNGATGLENWEGQCEGVRGCRFWLSDSRNSNCAGFEPNGDNNVDDALYLVGTGCDWGQWNDAHNNMSLARGSVICSTNDVGPAPATACVDALGTDSVYNTSETGGIDGTYSIDPEQDGSSMALTCDMTGGGWTVISSEDFEAAFSGWSETSTSSCFGTTMLGGFGHFGAGASPSKTFSLLNVPHTEVGATFTGYVIDSWDAENLRVHLDGTTVFNEQYSFGNAASNICGNSWTDIGAVRGVGAIPHTVDSVTLSADSTIDQPANDESWGIDDVVIRVR